MLTAAPCARTTRPCASIAPAPTCASPRSAAEPAISGWGWSTRSWLKLTALLSSWPFGRPAGLYRQYPRRSARARRSAVKCILAIEAVDDERRYRPGLPVAAVLWLAGGQLLDDAHLEPVLVFGGETGGLPVPDRGSAEGGAPRPNPDS